jgi:hypothetical protein
VIILPDRTIPRAKFLMPVAASEWRTPSQAQARDQFGNEVWRTSFSIVARCRGRVVWHGRFADREDFDAFLWGLATGFLTYDRPLWRLPTPWWHPDLGEDVAYQFVTTVSLTTTSGSAQNYTVPSDWGSAVNEIGGVGSGSGGAGGVGSFGSAGGGAGGAWASIINSTLTPGATQKFFLNVAGGTTTSTGASTATVGQSAWFRIDAGATAPAGTAQGFLAEGGGIGGAAVGGTGTQPGATGGRTGSCVGNTVYAGGGGGSAVASGAPAGGGGGGAAGPFGAGGGGATPTSTWGAGGTGDAANGGAGGGAMSAAGSNGSEIDSPRGSGGGGAGYASSTSSGTAGPAGLYGAGGGGAGAPVGSTAVGNAGAQGMIRVRYTPFIPSVGFNMPMMGF